MWEHGRPTMNMPVMIRHINIATRLDQHLKTGCGFDIREVEMMGIYLHSMKPGEMFFGQWNMRALMKLICQTLR